MAVKFLIAGTSSYIIYSLLLVIGIEFLKIDDILNNAISYAITFFYSFFLAKNWVFKTERKLTNPFKKYLIWAIINYLLNIIGFGVIIHLYNLHYLLVQFIMVSFVTILSYIAQRFWVFGQNK